MTATDSEGPDYCDGLDSEGFPGGTDRHVESLLRQLSDLAEQVRALTNTVNRLLDQHSLEGWHTHPRVYSSEECYK